MTRYRDTIEFIALNDEALEMDQEQIKGFLSVITASVAFGKPVKDIALDVVRFKAKYALKEAKR